MQCSIYRELLHNLPSWSWLYGVCVMVFSMPPPLKHIHTFLMEELVTDTHSLQFINFFCFDQRTAASILLHDGDDGDSQNNHKKQRFDTELLSTQDDKSHDPLTSTDNEVIRPSTMTKLSCFRKDSNVKDSSTKTEHSRAQNSKECVDDKMELDNDMDRMNLSSGCSFSGANMDDVKDMDVKKTENLQKVRPNLEQFACASRPASCKTKLTSTEKSEPNGSKTFNLKPKSAYTPLELQFVEVKSNYPDVILFVECGYRYRFFGEDAEVITQCFQHT